MAITKRQLIVDLDKYFEMGNMMSALTVIANFISQERNNRAQKIRKQLPLFMTGIEKNQEEIKGVLKKWKKDSPSKIEELIDVLEGLEEMEDEEREELREKLQAMTQEVVA